VKVFNTVKELENEIGKEIAISNWLQINQKMVDDFSIVTDDPQWIHNDIERAKVDSPYGNTIAHGYLTLSLITKLFEQEIDFLPGKISINYGLNKVRFPGPVIVGEKIRARFKLLSVKKFEKCVESIWNITIMTQNSAKPVCIAESILRKYF
tara:strand:+ start:395 stop:850 length:456 start_codon:yes stop_codon:yes gene_type:complete